MSNIKWMQQPCQQQQGGGGTIIIRSAMKEALNHPLVHGMLPESDANLIDPILAKDVGDWTHIEYEHVRKSFAWVAQHC